MSTTIDSELFKKSLYLLLDETFDQVRGIYLDKGTRSSGTVLDRTIEAYGGR